MLPFIIDGTDYSDTVIINSVEEVAELQEGLSARRLQSGDDWYNTIGTKRTRTVSFVRNMNGTAAKWNELFDVLSQPIDYRSVTIGTVSYTAHIVTVTRTMKDYVNGAEVWEDVYDVTFIPTELNGGVA